MGRSNSLLLRSMASTSPGLKPLGRLSNGPWASVGSFLPRGLAWPGLGGDSSVYTPQTTVDGREGIPGRARSSVGTLFAGRRGSALRPEGGETSRKAEPLLGGPWGSVGHGVLCKPAAWALQALLFLC